MKQVLHGDRVEAVIHENGDKKSVEPEKLIEAGLDRFVARVQKREGRLAVVPDHPSIRNVLKARIKNSLDEDSIADGDWVVARLVRHPLKRTTAASSPRSMSWWPKPTTPPCRGA